jgi:hypothetical protein
MAALGLFIQTTIYHKEGLEALGFMGVILYTE